MSRFCGRLPPWRAATETARLFAEAPPGLAAYRPRLTYHLIDEARLKLHPSDTIRNAVEALFRLEHGRTPDDLGRIIRALDALLRDPEQKPIRRTFTIWIKRLLRRKVGTSTMAEIEHIHDLLEADTMLAERIESWFDEATRKGVQQGVQQGMQQGVQQGRQQGVLKGQTSILSRQLRLRFGVLSPEVVERLSHATQAELDAWGEAILSAPTLAAVFGETWH